MFILFFEPLRSAKVVIFQCFNPCFAVFLTKFTKYETISKKMGWGFANNMLGNKLFLGKRFFFLTFRKNLLYLFSRLGEIIITYKAGKMECSDKVIVRVFGNDIARAILDDNFKIIEGDGIAFGGYQSLSEDNYDFIQWLKTYYIEEIESNADMFVELDREGVTDLYFNRYEPYTSDAIDYEPFNREEDY